MSKYVSAFLFLSIYIIRLIKLDAFLYQMRLGLESAGGPPGAPDGTAAVENSSYDEQPGRVEGWHGRAIFRVMCKRHGGHGPVWRLYHNGLERGSKSTLPNGWQKSYYTSSLSDSGTNEHDVLAAQGVRSSMWLTKTAPQG